MTEVSLIATLITPPSESGAELAALPDSVKWLEVRADLLGDINPEWIRKHFRGRLLYALRRRAEGGNCTDSTERRHRRLAEAARHYDRVELEGSSDLSESLLAEIPAESASIRTLSASRSALRTAVWYAASLRSMCRADTVNTPAPASNANSNPMLNQCPSRHRPIKGMRKMTAITSPGMMIAPQISVVPGKAFKN